MNFIDPIDRILFGAVPRQIGKASYRFSKLSLEDSQRICDSIALFYGRE
jgi:hypothetical protein